MKFCKYQGAGNDFVIADNMDLSIAASDIPALAADVCDRRFGVGADGFILAEPSGEADVKMDFYNADGSEASMCGNGIRCFAKFVTDHSIVRKTEFSVETGDGVKHIQVLEKTPSVTRVRVDMGTFSDKRNVKRYPCTSACRTPLYSAMHSIMTEHVRKAAWKHLMNLHARTDATWSIQKSLHLRGQT